MKASIVHVWRSMIVSILKRETVEKPGLEISTASNLLINYTLFFGILIIIYSPFFWHPSSSLHLHQAMGNSVIRSIAKCVSRDAQTVLCLGSTSFLFENLRQGREKI